MTDTTTTAVTNPATEDYPKIFPADYTPAAGGSTPPPSGAADPNVDSLSPNTGTVGNSVTVTVTGTNFESGAKVEVNQTAVPTTFVSATQLTATWTPAAAGTSTLTVRQGTEESNDVTFTVT